jgi:hypothetical protein
MACTEVVGVTSLGRNQAHKLIYQARTGKANPTGAF